MSYRHMKGFPRFTRLETYLHFCLACCSLSTGYIILWICETQSKHINLMAEFTAKYQRPDEIDQDEDNDLDEGSNATSHKKHARSPMLLIVTLVLMIALAASLVLILFGSKSYDNKGRSACSTAMALYSSRHILHWDIYASLIHELIILACSLGVYNIQH